MGSGASVATQITPNQPQTQPSVPSPPGPSLSPSSSESRLSDTTLSLSIVDWDAVDEHSTG
eukprot:2024663-Alexandrium_andersonii.AAC.1